MSKEKEVTKVKIVMLTACVDKDDNKVRYEVGTEVEFNKERAEAAVAAGYAEYPQPSDPEI
ncbi:MAG: hypothetical protein LBV18_04030 [Alistipes sp.]|jgi:hypothetical protein|nr:hypothetical protein [Alistipes sp.]